MPVSVASLFAGPFDSIFRRPGWQPFDLTSRGSSAQHSPPAILARKQTGHSAPHAGSPRGIEAARARNMRANISSRARR